MPREAKRSPNLSDPVKPRTDRPTDQRAPNGPTYQRTNGPTDTELRASGHVSDRARPTERNIYPLRSNQRLPVIITRLSNRPQRPLPRTDAITSYSGATTGRRCRGCSEDGVANKIRKCSRCYWTGGVTRQHVTTPAVYPGNTLGEIEECLLRNASAAMARHNELPAKQMNEQLNILEFFGKCTLSAVAQSVHVVRSSRRTGHPAGGRTAERPFRSGGWAIAATSMYSRLRPVIWTALPSPQLRTAPERHQPYSLVQCSL